MVSKSELWRAIEQVEQLLNQSWDLADNDFLSRRKEAIALRRSIADQTATIGKLGEAAFVERDQQDAFRQRFSATRTAMALHHASWPIVSIDLASRDYRASARSMRQAYNDFIDWVKSAAIAL